MASSETVDAAPDLSGVRLYSPGVLATYFVLGNLPIGMALYGLNVARRGHRPLGYFLIGIALLALVHFMLTVLAGHNLRSLTLLSLVVGLGVYSAETRPYQAALRRGAKPARWWPPLFAVAALFLAVAIWWPGL